MNSHQWRCKKSSIDQATIILNPSTIIIPSCKKWKRSETALSLSIASPPTTYEQWYWWNWKQLFEEVIMARMDMSLNQQLCCVWTLNFWSSEHRAKFTSAMSSRDKNHGLKGHNLEQWASKMLVSIWPSRDKNHGQNGHVLEPAALLRLNLELGTGVSLALCASRVALYTFQKQLCSIFEYVFS